jgi:PKD repeat protein
MTVVVQNPGVYWTSNTFNPEIGEPINLVNNSTFPQGLFTWNFGVNASPSLSNLTNPQGVTFNSAGIQNISLTYVTPLGCSQTVNKTINVIPNFSEGSCDAVVLNSFGNSSSNLYSIDRDKNANLYAVYKHSLNALNYTQSYHQDSLNLGLPPLNNYSNAYALIKYNSKGVPMWSIALRSNTSGDGGDVICDSTGNVYVAYYHDNFGDSLRIYSSDGRFISIMPPHSGSYSQSAVIIKYDSNGNYLWHTTFLDDYTLWKVSLKIDQHQNLFASGIYRCVKYNSTGILQWQKTGNFGDIEPDQNGGLYVLNQTGMIINHYSSSGAILASSFDISTIAPNTVIGARYLIADENGDLYVLGNFRGSFIYGLDTLTDIFSFGASHEDVYLAKFSSNLEHIWIKQFKGPSAMPLQGLDVSKNNVMASFLNTGSTMEFLQLDTLFQSASNAYFIFKCDTTGLNEQISMFYNSTASYIGSNIPNDNLKLSADGTSFDFGFEYKDNFTASTGTNFNMTHSTGYSYYGINLADVSCVFTENSSNNLPTAYFSAPINICQGQTINFVDGSTNNPTQWNWSFQGGNINQSSLSNPSVTFNSLGTFPISLISSNSFGQSQVYTSYVHVSSSPVATLSGDDYVCSGSYASVCINTTNSVLWPNGSEASCYSIGPLTEDSTIFVSVSTYGCQIELPFTFHVENEQQISFSGFLPDSVCSSQSSFDLPFASPSGGVYTSNFGGISGNSFVPSNAGYNSVNYIYYTYSTPNAGCTTQSMDSIFVLNSDLWVTILGDVQVCQDQSLYLYSTASSSVTEYHWNLNGGIGNDILASSTTAIFNEPGNYQISLTVSNNECQGPTVFQDVYVEATPNVELNDFIPNIVCSDAGLINVPAAIPSGGTYYDTQGAMVDSVTLNTANMIMDVPNYVYYFFSSPLGCSDLDSTAIIVEAAPNVQLNNFSPNILCSDAGLISVPEAIPSGGTYYDSQGAMIDGFTLNTEEMIIGEPNYVFYFYSSPTGCTDLDSTVITTSNCLGLAEEEVESYFISQGPVDYSYFINNLKSGNSVILYNEIGQIIRHEQVVNTDQLIIDLSKDSPGCYFLVIRNKDNQSVLRIFR